MTDPTPGDFAATIRPADVLSTLASYRPPQVRSIDLRVLPNQPDDPTTLEHVLHTVLTEVVTGWPQGSTWILEVGRGYLQGVHYSPDLLIEVGPQVAHPDLMAGAVARGWIDPRSVPTDHTDFRSRRIWGDNPLQELDWSSVGIPQTVATLAQAADEILNAVRGSGFDLRIFAPAHDEDGDATTETAQEEYRPDIITPVPLVELSRDLVRIQSYGASLSGF